MLEMLTFVSFVKKKEKGGGRPSFNPLSSRLTNSWEKRDQKLPLQILPVVGT